MLTGMTLVEELPANAQRVTKGFAVHSQTNCPKPPQTLPAMCLLPPCPTNRTQCCRCTSLNPEFISPKAILQQHCASARSLQELKARSLFAVAQGKDTVKAIQHLQVLPCLIFFLPFHRLFHMPPKMSYIFLLLHRVSLLNHSLLPPLLRNLFFFSLHGFFNLKDVCATKKNKNLASLFFLLHKFPFKWLERPWFL